MAAALEPKCSKAENIFIFVSQKAAGLALQEKSKVKKTRSGDRDGRNVKGTQREDEKNAKYIVENIYDILRELIEAKLALNGFKSYSHEATILFLKKFPEFKESEIRFMDNLRRIRNGIKYYGKDIEINETRKVIDFSRFILPKLKSLVKK